MAVLLLAGLGLAVTAAADDPIPPQPSPALSPSDNAWAEAMLLDEQRRQALRSPGAKSERKDSRTRYASMDATSAADLARQAFPSFAAAAPVRGDKFRGFKFLHFLDGHDATVQDPATGERVVARATYPLRVEDAHGKMAALDLTLDGSGATVEPENPAVPIAIDRDHRGKVSFLDQGFAFAPVGDPTSDAIVNDRTVFVPNLTTDTDYVVRPNSSGIESAFVLRSEASPERLTIKFTLPDGATLRRAHTDDPIPNDPPQAVEINRDGTTLGYLYPPMAFDADGTPVGSSLEIVGDSVVISVDHRDADVHYPILVDPPAMAYGSYSYGSWPGWGWTQQTYGGANFGSAINNPAYGAGLYESMPTNSWFVPGSYGTFYYQAPPATYIYRAYFSDLFHYPLNISGQSGNWSDSFTGVMNSAFSAWEPNMSYTVNDGTPQNANPFLTTFGFSNFRVDMCFNPRCDTSPGSEQNFALDGIGAYNPINNSTFYTGANKGSTLMQLAIVYLGDRYSPVFLSSPPADNLTWHKSSPNPISVSTADTGTGLYSITLTDQNGNDVDADTLPAVLCTGYVNINACPSSNARSVVYDPVDGHDTLNLTAMDASGRTARQTWHENVDNTPPSVSLSGPLSQQDGKQVAENAQELDVTASDPTSGLRTINVRVDGVVEQPSQTVGTPEDTSPHTLAWQFNPERYGAGKHVIRAEVQDWAGNVSTTQTVTVTVNHSAATAIEPGEMNLADGNFKLERSDVHVAAFKTDLSFSRSFSSRDPDARPDGGLGPGWIAGVSLDGADSNYVQLDDSTAVSDGVVEIVDTYGDAYDFAPNGAGGYIAPPDEPGLRLSKLTPSNQFELDDEHGVATIFSPQSGTLYAPTQVQQPGGGTSATYGYVQSGGGVPRVSWIIAPAPPGTSCSIGSPAGTGLAPGCRALTFDYATTTTATGTGSSQWGDVGGNLQSVKLWAADPSIGAEQSTVVEQYTYDSTGRLRATWDPRISPSLKETYDYDANDDVSKVTPPGEQPWTFTYRRLTTGPAPDANEGRLRSVSRVTPAGTATTTVVFGTPVSGAGAPIQMGSSDVAAWGQTAVPQLATAIFPPDQIPADPPTSWTRATMHYLDGAGHEVDEARPGGRISMTEYDAFDNPVRTLDAENRARAMAYGTAAAEHAARAAQLRVERTYSADGVRELEELGPLHSVRLSSGTDVQARRHTVMTYDEGAPPTGGPFNLVTTTKVGAAISGQSDSDVRTTTRGYSGVDSAGTANAGWTWRTPTSITVDPSGLNLQTAIVPDAATGQTAERRLPGNPAGGDAHSHKTIYYTVGANAADAGCGGAPALAALPCKELPAAQPTGGTGLPALPVTTHAYNRLWLETAKTDTVGSHTRTQSKGYDAAGRQTTESVTSDHGTAEPSLTFGYDTVTGRQTTVTANDTIPKTVTGGFDNVGRLASYTDADGNPASFTYDIDGRQATVNDGKGSRTMAYDATTGDLASIVDSGAGTITGSYDADGRLVSQTLPGGLQQQTTLDAAGDSSEIKYVKSGSTWFDQTLVRNVASQIVSESSALSARTIAYDNAARVSSEKRDSGPTNCVIDAYSYDADSNRLAKLSKSCSTATGTGPTHTYDTADRLTDAGYLYDSWGRTISVPAVDAGGSVLTAGFFVDDRLRSLGQGGRTRTFDVDPLRRVRVTTAVDPRNGNKTVTTVSTHHYVNDSDSPAWTAESSDGLHWTRNITGLDGDLVAIQDNQTGVTLQIENAQGEVIAAPTVSANTLGTAKESDAFGISGSTTPPRYGWLGAKQRRTELPTGVVAMGRRAYNPYLGRFLQADPVEGGSANGYDYVNQDPLNAVDLTGECAFYKPSCILHYVKKRVISIVLGCAAGAIVGPRMHGPIIVQVGSKFLKIFPVGRVSGCVIGAIPASLT